MSDKNTIAVKKPHPLHNNWGIVVWGDEELVARFKRETYMEFFCRRIDRPEYESKKHWNAFFQGESPDWIYYELWVEQTELFRRQVYFKVKELSERLGIPLDSETAAVIESLV